MQFVNKKTLVEIELVGDFNLEVLNCCEPYAVIDGKIFDVTRGNSLRIFITMDEMTFKSLKDKSKICVGMSLFSSQEYLVKTCKSNETPNALRLEKKLINKFPTLKENSDIQNKRRYKID
ncbi:MAG: hypothetical protein K1X72_02050 [Pyrinomonadaceae bacterium]|nr:hypothetical protein [Pyrinomonadaceae bacterium]